MLTLLFQFVGEKNAKNLFLDNIFFLFPEKGCHLSEGQGQAGRRQGLQDREEERARGPCRLQVGLGNILPLGQHLATWAIFTILGYLTHFVHFLLIGQALP